MTFSTVTTNTPRQLYRKVAVFAWLVNRDNCLVFEILGKSGKNLFILAFARI